MIEELSRTEVAGYIRTGFRSRMSERLASGSSVVFGTSGDR